MLPPQWKHLGCPANQFFDPTFTLHTGQRKPFPPLISFAEDNDLRQGIPLHHLLCDFWLDVFINMGEYDLLKLPSSLMGWIVSDFIVRQAAHQLAPTNTTNGFFSSDRKSVV